MATFNGTTANNSYAGTATADSVFGGAGNDTLSGAAGNDIVDGGIGNDSLTGGDGADQIFGDRSPFDPSLAFVTTASSDSLIYAPSTGVFSYATGGNLGTLGSGGVNHRANVASSQVSNLQLVLPAATGRTLDTGETIGFSFVDETGKTITVSSATVQQSSFGNGATEGTGVLTAQGADQDGRQVAVLLKFNQNNGAPPTAIAAGNAFLDFDTDGAAGNVVVPLAQTTSVAAASDPGAGNDTIAAGTGDDTVAGGAGDDQIKGEAGADSLSAGAGADTVIGGTENDIIDGSDGNDLLFGDRSTIDPSLAIFATASADSLVYAPSTGVFSYATGGNLGTLGSGGVNHRANVASSQVSGLKLILPAATGRTLDTGETIGFSFVDETGKTITVSSATVQQSSFGNGATEGTGVLTAQGADQDGRQVAVLLKFNQNNGAPPTAIAAGNAFFDYDNDGAAGNVVVPLAQTTTLAAAVNAGAGNDTITGGAGNDTIQGEAGDDLLAGDDGDDTIYGGIGNDTLSGGSGNDLLYGDEGDDEMIGSNGNDTLNGGAGADTINGVAGNDLISGDAGNDTIFGGAGAGESLPGGSADNDTLFGGAGDDVLSGHIGDDSIDGGTGNDTITGDSGNILNADQGNDTLLGGDGNDSILGNGDNDTIDGGAGNDTIYGGTDNDTLSGGTGDDLIFGGAAGGAGDSLPGAGTTDNDLIFGGTGNDTITGGAGSDTISLADGFGNDIVNGSEDAGNTDIDILDASAVTEGVNVVYGANPENGTLTGQTSANQVTFSNIEKVLFTNQGDLADATAATTAVNVDTGAGNDTVDAGAGNDTIATGTGDDTVAAGTGDDTVDAGTGNDTVDGGAGNDSVAGGAGNDSLAGGAGNDTLAGGDGTDTIAGGAGNDSLDGGLGDDDIVVGAGDTALGGGGDDVFTVDSTLTGNAPITVIGGETSEDLTDPANGGAGDVLDLRGLTGVVVTPTGPESGTATYTNAAGETVTITYSEIETVLTDPPPPAGPVDGTAGADTMGPGYTDPQGDQIDGTDGLNDTILAGAGNDTVDAGLGDDTVDAGDGNDSVTGGVGNDSVAGGAGNDTVGGGDGNDTVNGGTGDDSVTGGLGDDTLLGDLGNDTMLGGDGNDSVSGGLGNDSIIAGAGNDTVDAGDGDNFVNTRNSPGLGVPDIGLVFPGDPALTYPADTAPNDDRDLITTGSGNDTILSGDDRDTIVSGAGNDVVEAGFDDDSVDGGDGNDTLSGSEGRDTILGGAGDDLIAGALPPTDPNYAASAVYDLIDDPVGGVGADPVPNNNNDLIFGGTGNDSILGGDDDDTISGGADNDTIDGGIDDDLLTGDDGNDVLIGGQGNDTMDGGAGNDTLTAGAGDQATGAGGDDRFVITSALPGNAVVSVVGGETGETTGDVLDLTGATDRVVVYNAADPTFNGTTSESGTVTYKNAAGETVTVNFSQIETVVVCFAAGTMIDTASGEKPIESLEVGDLVRTADHDYQPIRWIGSSKVAAVGHVAPILIKAGALGNTRDLKVSPQHRMLLGGWQAEMLFGDDEVLVAAKHLVNDATILRVEGGDVEYFHMLFDTHEIVFAEGAPSESFHPGQEGWGALAEEARAEILELFPELAEGDFAAYGASARRSLKAFEASIAAKFLAEDDDRTLGGFTKR